MCPFDFSDNYNFVLKYGLVVQLVRMPPCHGGGRGFESRPVRKVLSRKPQIRGKNSKAIVVSLLLFLFPSFYFFFWAFPFGSGYSLQSFCLGKKISTAIPNAIPRHKTCAKNYSLCMNLLISHKARKSTISFVPDSEMVSQAITDPHESAIPKYPMG
jgi:hypothetical protein